MAKIDESEGLRHLAECDPDFAAALDLIQPLPSRARAPGFEPLAKIIIEQQVSLASAEAIWKRISAAIIPFTPDTMLRHDEETLRGFGLSRQKARYCRALAEEVTSGRLDFEKLHHMDDEAVTTTLTAVKGIGRWTAEIYLMACLERQDVWPAGDVALQSALQHMKKLDKRPNAADMDTHGECLRPHRTLAARVLWRYYADVVQAPTRKKK